MAVLTRSASDIRIEGIATFVAAQRAAGKSDDDIIEALKKQTGLTRSNPCAGIAGENLCTPFELLAGVAKAPATHRRPQAASKTNYWIIAGVALAAWLFMR